MKNALVTIIITTYKRKPDMVMRAVHSAMNQSYLNTEIILVDDSPSDYIYREEIKNRIISLNSNKIKVIWHEKNLGACIARNTAIKASSGDYIIYLDDDDEFCSNIIEKRLSAFINDRIGLVYGPRYICINNNKDNMYVPKQKLVSGRIFNETIKKNNIAAFPMIKRECFDVCGLFDPNQLSAQDYEMWLRILQKYDANFNTEPLSIVHIHEGERITSTPYKAIQGTKRICQLYKKYYMRHPFAYHYRKQELCKLYCSGNDKRSAAKYLAQAIVLAPYDCIENLRLLKMIVSNTRR